VLLIVAEIASLSAAQVKDAKRCAEYLVTRFKQAEQKSADPLENLKRFGLPMGEGKKIRVRDFTR